MDNDNQKLKIRAPHHSGTVVIVEQPNSWAELKIEGWHISSRAYASLTLHQDIIYVYGGYQLTDGVLQNFYSLNLSLKNYIWTKILANVGPLTRHTGFAFGDAIYMQGGMMGSSKQSNLTHRFDVPQQTWTTLECNATYPGGFDNHASTQIEKDGVIAIFGGYFQGSLSSQLYFYNISSNEWTKYHPTQSDKHKPSAREGCSLVHSGDQLFVFGGSDGVNRMNDLWSFDLQKQLWHFVIPSRADYPLVRNGCSMNAWGEVLLLFGGIHDITWELDDFWMFKEGYWWRIDEEKKIKTSEQTVEGAHHFRSAERSDQKQKLSPVRSPHRGSVMNATTRSQKFQLTQKMSVVLTKNALDSTDQRQKSRLRTLEDQRRKEMEMAKMDMLKLFEVNEAETTELRSQSPTSETMRNALLLIGNPGASKQKVSRLTDFGKESVSKFMQPLKNTSNLIKGRRPCARDGHRSVIYQDHLIVFGGDRHQMSFNDIFTCRLNLNM